MTNVDDYMEGGGGYPLVKLTREGSKLVGDLIEARIVAQRDYDTGEIERWDNGDPKKQLVIDLRIDWAESVDITTGKDGEREEIGTYYCRWLAEQAIREACRNADVKMSKVGRLALARTKDGVPRNKRHAPPQQFVAKVKARTAGADVDDLMDGPGRSDEPATVPDLGKALLPAEPDADPLGDF